MRWRLKDTYERKGMLDTSDDYGFHTYFRHDLWYSLE